MAMRPVSRVGLISALEATRLFFYPGSKLMKQRDFPGSSLPHGIFTNPHTGAHTGFTGKNHIDV